MASKPKPTKQSFFGYLRPASGLLSFITIGLLVVLAIPVLTSSVKTDSYLGNPKNIPIQLTIQPKPEGQTATPTNNIAPPPTQTTVTAPVVSPPKTVTPKPTVSTPAPVVIPSPSSNVSNLTPATSSGSATAGSDTSSSSSTQTITNYDSSNWSGYMATSSTYTSVSSSWIATSPLASSGSLAADATWIGIGGVTTSDLIQVGTQNTVEPNGQIQTSAFYEMLPAASQNIGQMTVSPGDHMSATINETSPGQWSISIADLTDNQTYALSVSYSSTNSSAEWIQEDPSFVSGRLINLDNFGTATFTNGQATVAGKNKNISGSNPDSITMVNRQHQSLAIPSALSGSGDGFSVSWQNP